MRAPRSQPAKLTAIGLVGALFASLVTTASADGITASRAEIVTRNLVGATPNEDGFASDVSPNGRFVVFFSEASDIVSGDGGGFSDIFVVDRLLDTTEKVSVSSSEVPGNGESFGGSISDDGVRVVFLSYADNLVPDDDNDEPDIFLRNRVTGNTSRVSVTSSEGQVNGPSGNSTISGNGLVVAFDSSADGLVPAEIGVDEDVFVRDLLAGTTEIVSESTLGTDGNSGSSLPSISRNGQYVGFISDANNLVPIVDTNNAADNFVRDRTADTTSRVSLAPGLVQQNDESKGNTSISDDGRYVAFTSRATNLAPGEAPADDDYDVFLYDRTATTVQRVSVTSAEVVGNGESQGASISADGDRVAFVSKATNLGGTATINVPQIRDRSAGTTTGYAANPDGTSGAWSAQLSSDGRYLVWDTSLTSVPTIQAFVRVLVGATFTDVPTLHAFFEEISWLVDSGITTGFPDDTYRPGSSVTRQAMAAFLYRQSGSPAFVPPVSPSFSDVPTDHPFYKEIEWAVADGLADGFPDDTFRPGIPITRQAMAAFLYRVAGEPAFAPPGTPTFTDVSTTHPFRTEIGWMAATGLANGFPDGTFRPGDVVTRQATAAFLFRIELLGF